MPKYSNSFKNLVGDHDGYAHILTGQNAGASAHAGTGKLYVYAGTDPADANAALTGETLLGIVTSDAGVGSTFLTFAAMSAGVLAKNASEVWSTGAMTISGGPKTATYARFVNGSDDPTVADTGTGHPRVHLSIAQIGQPPGDINLVNPVYASGESFNLDAFQINLL
jgi:hypothetical protein